MKNNTDEIAVEMNHHLYRTSLGLYESENIIKIIVFIEIPGEDSKLIDNEDLISKYIQDVHSLLSPTKNS